MRPRRIVLTLHDRGAGPAGRLARTLRAGLGATGAGHASHAGRTPP
jgi:hypothetical protein